jgi:hypothetical protein
MRRIGMTDEALPYPDLKRADLIRSVFKPSSLEKAARAISEATEFQSRVYVERTGSWYRWSLVHPGGPYPLLRVTALFLRMDHHHLVIGFKTLENGLCVLSDPERPAEPDAWQVLQFEGKESFEAVQDMVLAALGVPGAEADRHPQREDGRL